MNVKVVGTIQFTTAYTIVQETVINGIKYGKLKSGAGWIRLGEAKPTVDLTIHPGDIVSIVGNPTTAIDYDGNNFRVYEREYTVLCVNGNRVVISSDGKNVTAAVQASILKKK